MRKERRGSEKVSKEEVKEECDQIGSDVNELHYMNEVSS